MTLKKQKPNHPKKKQPVAVPDTVLECRQCGRQFDEEEVYLDDALLTF